MNTHPVVATPEPPRMAMPGRQMLSLALPEQPRTVRQLDDGQYEFEGIAQYFDRPNTHGMIFRRGSFAKTLQEGLPLGRIKVNDTHIQTGNMTLGSVVEAEERSVGLWYRARLSSTAGDYATKLMEGHLDQNSIEFYSILEDPVAIDVADLPLGTPLWWFDFNDAGQLIGREIKEAAWDGIALCPQSSQQAAAMLSTCSDVQPALRVVSRPGWDAASAAARVEAFDGDTSRVYLLFDHATGLRTGLAGDVDGDELVLCREALPSAAADCMGRLGNVADLVEFSSLAARVASAIAAFSGETARASADPAADSFASEPGDSETLSDAAGDGATVQTATAEAVATDERDRMIRSLQARALSAAANNTHRSSSR